MKLLSFIIIFLFNFNLVGQIPTNPTYKNFINQADSLFKNKEFKKAGTYYNKAFEIFQNKGFAEDRYKAAKAWSLARENDSAFKCLNRLIIKRFYITYEKVTNDSSFSNLISDIRWTQLIDTLKVIKITTTQPKSKKTLTNFSLKNKEKRDVSVYLIDYYNNQREIFYFELKRKQTRQQETYIGSVWVIRLKSDSSQVLEFMISSPNQKFDTNGQLPYDK